MFSGNALNFFVLDLRQFHSRWLKYVFVLAVIWLVCWQFGPKILSGLFFLTFITLLFMVRIDIALYAVLILWKTGVALPLPIASPFTPGAMADLPLYELGIPLLGFCLLIRIAMGKERIASSPLKIPLLLWFGLIILTYFRNPIFFSDLLSKSGTGMIYQTLYRLFLCFILYLAAASLLRTRQQIAMTVKVIFIIMIVGILLGAVRLFTRWEIPGLAEGGWSIDVHTDKGGTIMKSMALAGYSHILFLALLCFGSHLRKPLQVLISVLLMALLVLGGGRSGLIAVCVYLLLSFIIQPKTRWLIIVLSLSMILFGLILAPNIRIPYTARRVVNFSPESGPGAGSVAGRLWMIRDAWNITKKHPLIGIGYGRTREYLPGVQRMNFVTSGNVHAGFMAVMMIYGLIGLGIFLFVVFAAVRIGWKLYRETEDHFLRQLVLLITFYIIAAFFLFFVASQTERSFNFYFGMGMLSSIYGLLENRSLPDEADKKH